MSHSETKEVTCTLIADAGDPFVEMHVLDSRLVPVPLEHNLSRIEAPLAAGVYVVRFQAGHTVEDRLAVLEPGTNEPEVIRLAPPLPFAATAPLAGTAAFRPEHGQAVHTLGKKTPAAPLGANTTAQGDLLVFMRDPDFDPKAAAPVNLARGICIYTLDGDLVCDLEESGQTVPQEGWAGCYLRLPAGPYRVRRATKPSDHEERSVWVSAGWRTLLFFLVRPSDGEEPLELGAASLLMLPQGEPLNLAAPSCRQAELAWQALDGKTAKPPAVHLSGVLEGANHGGDLPDPLCLLLEGRLQLRREKQVNQEYLRNLHQRLVEHNSFPADTLALGHDLLDGPLHNDKTLRQRLDAMPPVTAPPLLFASWQTLLRAARTHPRVIQPGGLADTLAGFCKPVGPWLAWWSGGREKPPVPAPAKNVAAPASPPAKAMEELQALLEKLWRRLQDSTPWLEAIANGRVMDIGRVAAETIWPPEDLGWQQLRHTATRLLERMRPKGPELLQQWFEQAKTPPQVADFLETLMLPPHRGAEVMQKLLKELHVLEVGRRLRQLSQNGRALPALRSAHMVCRRLVLFDDFCQEVYLRALQHADTFQGHTEEQFIGWLKAIGRQLAVNYLRKSRTSACEPLPQELQDRDRDLIPDKAIQRETTQQETAFVAGVFASLRPEERELLYRYFYRDETLTEIAKSLGVTQNTLNKRYGRLLLRLRAWHTSQDRNASPPE